MKHAVSLALLVLSATAGAADTYTPGYVRKDGTVVQGHYSTSPNGTKLDNYSTRGNVNPYTGQAGTVDPYRSPNGGYNNGYVAPPSLNPNPNINNHSLKSQRGW